MKTTFIILFLTTISFISGKLRSDLVAIGALLALTLTGIITPEEALAGFSNSVVIMIAGLFVVGAGIFNSGLAKKLGNTLLQYGKGNETKLLIIIMITVGVFSALMSNTGTVAVLLPVVISIAMSMQVSPAQLLMPLAFASSLGGVLTLIGTPPNLVVSSQLEENGFAPLHFFSFAPIGLIVLISGIIFIVLFGRRLLPKRFANASTKQDFDLSELIGLYKVQPLLKIIEIHEYSPLVGKQLKTLRLPNTYGISIISIERKNGHNFGHLKQKMHIIPKAKTTLVAGDVMLIFGEKEKMKAFITENKLVEVSLKDKAKERNYLLSREFGIAEMIIPPQSNFEHKTIRELQFRKKYGCSVLAIFRNGRYIQTDACKVKLQAGDALLIHGEWKRMEAIDATSDDLIVVSRIDDAAKTESGRGKAPIAAIIMIFMLLFMTLELLEPVIIVLIAALLMVITRCVRSLEDGYKAINWESLVLIAAMLPMATALEKTGGVQFISNYVIDLLGSYGPYAVLSGFYLLTMIMSQFISNTATAVIFAPIALTTAIELGVSPYPFVIAVAVSASMAFATPVASPTNALVMNAGGYQFKDYVKVGVPLQIVLAIISLIFIPILYPL